MPEPGTPRRAAPPARDLVWAAGAALFAALLLAAAHAFGDGLGSSDLWRHIAWASLLRSTPPGALRVWPVFTPFARENVDIWALYHRLLIPFTFGNLEFGARAASVFYGALSLGALAFVLRRLNAAAAPVVFAGALALAPGLFDRALQARPAALGTALLELSALALIQDAPAAAFACAWAHSALHITFVLQGVLAAAALIAGRFSPASRRGAAAIAAGSALGVLLRPRPGAYIRVAFLQGTRTFLAASRGFADLGTEMYPPSAALLAFCVPVLIAVAWSSGRLRRSAARPAADRRFLLVCAAAFGAAALAAIRFLDAAGAFAALALCASLPAAAIRPRLRALLLAALAAPLFVMLRGASASLSYPYGSADFRGAAAALRAGVPPGAVVFNDDWRSWAKLFHHDPTHRYVVGCDPTLMLAVDPRRFRLWRNLSLAGLPCAETDVAACPPSPSPAALAAAVRDFGAEAVVLSRTREYPRLKAELDAAPGFFRPLDAGADAARGIAVYRLAPPGDAPR